MDDNEYDEYNPKKRKRNDDIDFYDAVDFFHEYGALNETSGDDNDNDFYDAVDFLYRDESSNNTSTTAVIAITTHGAIVPIGPTSAEPQIFTIPQGLQVIKISFANVGNSSCTNADYIDNFIDYAIQLKPYFLNNDETIVEQAINYAIDELKHTDKITARKSLTKKSNENDVKYLRKYDAKIVKHVLNSGDKITNKIYASDPHISEINKHRFHRKITLISGDVSPITKQLPDLLADEGQLNPDNVKYIHLNSLLEYFTSMGKNKVIIFDLSCSNFLNANDRETRVNRRQLLKSKIATGGKNKRKFKQKTKKTRNTKRHKKTKKWKK